MSDPLPRGQAYARNVEVVGYSDLGGRPGFKLAMQEGGGRWYLYLGHLWHRGWSILDVTDPAAPQLLSFVPGPSNTWTGQIQVAAGKMLTGLERIDPSWGGDPNAPNEEGVLIWDVNKPTDPVRLGHFRTGGTGTHRNYYDGGRYVHLASAAAGYTSHIYQVIDIEDPEHPKEVSRWWLPGQWRDGGERPEAPPHLRLHGGAYVEGDRAYLPYSSGGLVILDITDIAAPRLVSRLPFSPPFLPFIAVHTAVPLQSRKLVVVNSEAIQEGCREPANFAGLVDISDEAAPRLISLFPLPEPPPGAPYRNFCEKGGRFGPHNQHQPQHQRVLRQRDDLVYLTYFNAGLRIVDISDPLLPREVGYFIPPDPEERIGLLPKTLVAQSEDVLVDARGYIYLTDKNHGLYVLRHAGGTQ